MKELTFGQLFAILRRRAIALLAIVLACTLAVAMYFYGFRRDVYTAEAVLYVLDIYTDSSDNTRYDTGVSAQLAADYKVLLGKEPLLDRCAQALGVASLDGVSIDIYSESGTRVLTLAVTGADPAYCARVANAVAATFVDYIRALTDADGLSVALEAEVPTEPSGPHRLLYTGLALVGSLLFCVALAIVMELSDKKLRTEEDVAILNLPVLARVKSYGSEMRAFLSNRRREKASLLESVSAATRESVKALLTNVQFADVANPPRTLMITSAVAEEGKSSLAVMLASVAADEQQKVLLVDMDFRNPSVGMLLRARGKSDLIDCLHGAGRLDAAIRHLSRPNLSFIDSLHRSASAGNTIRSAAFGRFLDHARANYDLVIFDVAPVGLFIDAAVLASKVDATVLVVASGRPNRKAVLRAVDQIRKVRGNLIGVALNFLNDDPLDRTYDSHYDRYGSSGAKRRAAP